MATTRSQSVRNRSSKRSRNKAYYAQSRKAGCRKTQPRVCITRMRCKMARGTQRKFCRTKRNRRY